MKQTKLMSMLETALSTAAGFGLSLFLQWLILPYLLGIDHIPLQANLAFTLVMTVASLSRGYLMRRLFELFHIRRPLSPFMQAVIAERFRQIEGEGWELSHDDAHDNGELGRAGACYIIHAGTQSPTPPHDWPWADDWWKPKGFRRDLVRGGALLMAEGERFDRMRKSGRGR